MPGFGLNFETWPSYLPDKGGRAYRLRQELGMPSEIAKRTVPKYKIVYKELEACPLFVKAQLYIYEIKGNTGQYSPKFELNTSLRELKDLDSDLERAVVILPDHVKDMSNTCIN